MVYSFRQQVFLCMDLTIHLSEVFQLMLDFCIQALCERLEGEQVFNLVLYQNFFDHKTKEMLHHTWELFLHLNVRKCQRTDKFPRAVIDKQFLQRMHICLTHLNHEPLWRLRPWVAICTMVFNSVFLGKSWYRFCRTVFTVDFNPAVITDWPINWEIW